MRRAGSLQLDGAAGFLEALLELLGFGLGNAFLDRLRGALDQRLGFAEAEEIKKKIEEAGGTVELK